MLQTLTEKIYAKSDAALRDELIKATSWVWDETGYGREPAKDVDVAGAMRGTEFNTLAKTPWLGAVRQLFVETAFAYLRDIRREKAVTEFMRRVEDL